MLKNIFLTIVFLLKTPELCTIKHKRYMVMKVIRIYSYYSLTHRAWAHIKAYNKHEALEKARVYDPYVKISDLSLLMYNGRYV